MSYENYKTWREVLEGQKKSKLQDENEGKTQERALQEEAGWNVLT